MARSIAIIFILVLAAVQTLALPGGGEAIKPGQKKPTNYNATWSCTYKYKGLWDRYKLTGRDWGVNETMLRKCVDKAGIVTKWKYSNWTKDGHEGFVSTFNLPLASAQRLGTHSNQELGINPFNEDENGYLLTGVECGPGKVDD